MERYAPASPVNAPQIISARQRKPATDRPATSTACGFSPTARSRKPKRVRSKTSHVTSAVKRAAASSMLDPPHASPRNPASGSSGTRAASGSNGVWPPR
jgi:hypothetical protein